MFLDNSRYKNVATVQVEQPDGTTVVALKLRRLTPLEAVARDVRAGDRLDLIAHELNGDATQFWHIADANTALDSRTLVATAGDTVLVPKG
jgi:nucleoid-associated protein YgaU